MEQTLTDRSQISGVKLVVGSFFAALGLLLTAANLGILGASQFLRYWPLVIVAVGVLKLMDETGRIFGALITVLGVSMLARTTGLLHVSLFDLWPLLLIAAGVATVLRAMGVQPRLGQASRYIWAILSNRVIANDSPDFRGASVAAFLGGCQLDLTAAGMTSGPAIVEALAFWGGVVIIVPETWEIIGEAVPIMGGFEIKAANPRNPQRQLIVRGLAMMGGIEVKGRTA